MRSTENLTQLPKFTRLNLFALDPESLVESRVNRNRSTIIDLMRCLYTLRLIELLQRYKESNYSSTVKQIKRSEFSLTESSSHCARESIIDGDKKQE